MKYSPPFFFRFQIDEKFCIEKPGRIRSVVGSSHLTPALRNFRKRTKHDPRLIHDPDALIRPGARSQGTADPQSAFIQMRKKFRANGPAKREKIPDGHHHQHHANGDGTVANGPTHRDPVAVNQKGHDRVVPFFRAFLKSKTCQHRRNHN